MRLSPAARHRLAPLAVTAVLGVGVLAGCGEDVDTGDEPTITAGAEPDASSSAPSSDDASPSDGGDDGPPEVTGTVTEGLQAPWGLDFLPNGDAILTERDSRRVLTIDPDTGEQTEVGVVEPAVPSSEAGLLGVAVSPDFAQDDTVFLYYTTESDNRVARTTLVDGELGELDVILDGIPLNTFHDGGRLAFGPDGMLYVSTGDAGDPDLSQDLSSLAGKILRITPEGEVPRDNPRDDTPLWSLGHRNVQGLAFDDDGRLWASEFGDQTFDELNLVEPGLNYGWPENEGTGDVRGGDFTNPQVVWGTDEASPSGLAYADGALWVAALQGERLWRVPVDGDRAGEPESLLEGEYGRIREVAETPDGSLWVVTNNTDTRGEPRAGDDRILRLEP